MALIALTIPFLDEGEATRMASWLPQPAVGLPNSGFRLVGIDLDGLLQPQGVLHATDAAAIRTAHTNGAKVALLSAKTPQEIHRYWAQLGLGTPVIALNGALVYDYPTHRPILGQPVPAEAVRQVLAVVRKVAPKAGVGCELGGKWATNRLSPMARWLIAQTGAWPASIGDLSPYLNQPIYQLWIDAEPSQLETIQTETNASLLAAMRFTQPNHLVLRSAAASRGWALASLATWLGIPPHQVMAIGDGGQDRTWLQAAAFAVLTRETDIPGDLQTATVSPVVVTTGIAEALERYVPPMISVVTTEEETKDTWLPTEL